MKCLFLLCLGFVLAGCAVPDSSFNPPVIAHETQSDEKYFGTWRTEKKNGDALELRISDYAAKPWLTELIRQEEDNSASLEERLLKFRSSTLSLAFSLRHLERKKQTPNPLCAAELPPMAGFRFRIGEKQYVCAGFDLLGVCAERWNLLYTANLIQVKFFLFELEMPTADRMILKSVNYTQKETVDGRERSIPLDNGLRLYEHTALNSGSELTEILKKGTYTVQEFGDFRRVK